MERPPPHSSGSGQVTSELRQLLDSRRARIEGTPGQTQEYTVVRASMGDSEAGGSPQHGVTVQVPRITVPTVPVGRSNSVPDNNGTPVKSYLSARALLPRSGTSAISTPPVNGSPTANVNRQPSATGAPPPPCARGVGTTVMSPNSRIQAEYRSQNGVEASTPQKIQSEYRGPLTMQEKMQREFRNLEVEKPEGWQKATIEADRPEGWPPKVPQMPSDVGVRTVPVEDATRLVLPSGDRLSARTTTTTTAYRGVQPSEAEKDSHLRMRKVSCGKLYEELAYLRKENMRISRTNAEMEQRMNDEVPQQLADEVARLREENQELAKLRQDCSEMTRLREENKALERERQELRDKVSRLDESRDHDTLMGTVNAQLDAKAEEFRRQQEATQEQLAVLRKQSDKFEEQRRGAAAQEEAMRRKNEGLSSEIEELKRALGTRPPPEKLEELSEQLQDAHRQNSALRGELESARGCHAQDVSSLRQEHAGLQRKYSELEQHANELGQQAAQVERQQEELAEQRRQSSSLMQENRRLSMEVQQLSSELRSSEERCQNLEQERTHLEQDRRKSMEEVRRLSIEVEQGRRSLGRRSVEPPEDEEEAEQAMASPCSHSRLKSVLTDRGATVDDLKNAIGAAEALLGEARREFAAKQLRERRACYERLHTALEGENEDELAEAIAAAQKAEVDAEDIAKGEAKLTALRSQTAEQRRAKALHELSLQRKKEAFLLVKKDDAEALRELLRGLDEAVRWQDWRDYMGRDLWRFANELHVTRVQECLAPLLGKQLPQEKRRLQVSQPEPQEQRPQESQAAPVAAAAPVEAATDEPARKEAEATEGQAPAAAPEPEAAAPPPTKAEEEELQRKAFRAVVQDNTTVLLEVLQRLSIDTWSKWQNKAGKDLLTLSQERGSSGAYSVLAKALGLVQEQKREAFDEREAVWIFAQGEVQPKRATVLEDTPEEADEVLVEFWDGDDPPCRVERCLVRKMWS